MPNVSRFVCNTHLLSRYFLTDAIPIELFNDDDDTRINSFIEEHICEDLENVNILFVKNLIMDLALNLPQSYNISDELYAKINR